MLKRFAPVGWPVMWYSQADRANRPVPALVNSCDDSSGSLAITVFRPNSGVQYMTGVRHIEDTFHQRTDNEITLMSGGWDYVPGLYPMGQHELEVQKFASGISDEMPATLDPSSAEMLKIMELSNQGLNAPQIADALGGRYSRQRIAWNIRCYKLQQNAVAVPEV